MRSRTGPDEAIVLVVDDDASMRQALTNLFESVGLQVEAFGSAAEILQANPPKAASCLVLDIRLPGLSGLELQSDLAKANIHTPIIFITGHGDIPMTVQAMKSGAVDFLTKPVREQDLLDAVQAAIERDRKRRDLENGLRVAIPLRKSDVARARHFVTCRIRPIEQASGGRAWPCGNYGQDLSRASHAQNGREIVGRSHKNE